MTHRSICAQIGKEFVSTAVVQWLADENNETAFNAPGEL